jgi:sulfur-carrier protein
VKILLFGSLRDAIGAEIAQHVPLEGCSIARLRKLIVANDEACAPLASSSVRASVDKVLVREDHIVRPGQEVAFFPMFSGG